MRFILALLFVVVGSGGLLATWGFSKAFAASPHAALIAIDGIIQPSLAGFLSRGIDEATEAGAELAILRIDTPGGLLTATRDMVSKTLESDIPIVAYVSPSGVQAASAGTFVVAAAHVAAMAPATNIGAASPVGSGGEELPETLKSKATQDAAAFIRSIAEERGRNAEALEQTVLNAASFTDTEALEKGIIDIIAEDIPDLLAQLDGRTVKLRRGDVVLHTEGLELRTIDRNPLERFLAAVGDPNIAFLLLTLGGMALLVEFLHPGIIVAGVFGAIALALAFVGMGNLPVNWVGVGLIGLAMALFFFEFQAPGIGIFGVGGVISFLLGAFLLFGGFSPPPISRPSFRISVWVIAAVSSMLFGSLILLFRAVLEARKARYSSGIATLVGETGTTTTPLAPRGTVQVSSELWSAVSDSGEPIPEDEEVIVAEVEGNTLKVFKASKVRE